MGDIELEDINKAQSNKSVLSKLMSILDITDGILERIPNNGYTQM